MEPDERSIAGREIAPVDLAVARDVLVVDVRPHAERYGGIGFIPGSLSLPVDLQQAERLLTQELAAGRRMVICCLSGRRSLELAVELARAYPRDTPISLAGGLLGWQAAGLPLAGLDARWHGAQELPVAEAAGLCRTLAACFMAEAIELSLDAGFELDPMVSFTRCCEQAGVDPKAPDLMGLLRVLDFAAERSRELGNDYERIAANVDRMLALIGLGPEPAIGAA